MNIINFMYFTTSATLSWQPKKREKVFKIFKLTYLESKKKTLLLFNIRNNENVQQNQFRNKEVFQEKAIKNGLKL